MVVVPIEDEVKTIHRRYRFAHGILMVFRSDDALVHARMEQTDDEVGIFLFLHERNPFLCTFPNIFETHSLPHAGGYPVRNGGSDEANDCNLHTTAIEHGVRLKIRLFGFEVDGVGTEDGKVAIANEEVENIMSCLDVVIPNHSHIVADEVAHVSHFVTLAGMFEIEVIGCRFSLQHVAAIYENRGT